MQSTYCCWRCTKQKEQLAPQSPDESVDEWAQKSSTCVGSLADAEGIAQVSHPAPSLPSRSSTALQPAEVRRRRCWLCRGTAVSARCNTSSAASRAQLLALCDRQSLCWEQVQRGWRERQDLAEWWVDRQLSSCQRPCGEAGWVLPRASEILWAGVAGLVYLVQDFLAFRSSHLQPSIFARLARSALVLL